jgi:cytochrome c oxidase subunit 4
MSATDTTPASSEASEAEGHADHDEHMHPSDWKYIQIAIILALLTAAEVATYYVDLDVFEIPVLLSLMVVKFVLVIMWFMHLKFDSPMFSRVFVAGLGMAVLVYCAALSMFEFWS